MWHKKKLILLAVLATTLVLAATLGGVALAQTGTTDNTSSKTLIGRVATILGIDQQTVENAFTQARKDMQTEELDSYLKNLVAKDKITQEQADQYMTWWKSRPDMSQYQQQLREWMQARPGFPSEMKDWQEAMPDDVPLPRVFGARGFRGGMKGGRGFCW